MAVLLTLLMGSVAARVVGSLGVVYVDSWPKAIAVGLAAMFVMTGGAHLAPGMRRDMIAIVPPRLPAPGALVTVTGQRLRRADAEPAEVDDLAARR